MELYNQRGRLTLLGVLAAIDLLLAYFFFFRKLASQGYFFSGAMFYVFFFGLAVLVRIDEAFSSFDLISGLF